MKYIKQLLIILFISFLGEVLKALLPLPIPASIYGMGIMFAGLMTGLIKLAWIEETAKYLIAVMPLMFIPAAVGLISTWDTLGAILVPVCIITVVTNVTVMIAAGWVSQIIIRKTEGKKHE